MNIVVYSTPDPKCLPQRRWCAQFDGTNPRLQFSFYGADEAEARSKAQVFWDDVVVPTARLKKAEPVSAPAPAADLDDPFGDLM